MAVFDTAELLEDSMIGPVTGEIIDQKGLAEWLLTQAEEQGVSLVGPGGLLSQPTKNVFETVLNAELTERLGHDRGGTLIAENVRNGIRSKTVLTEVGLVEIEVPRDRDGSFEPVIVPKRKRCLGGIDQIVLSLTARGADDRGNSPRTSTRFTGSRCLRTLSAGSRRRSPVSWLNGAVGRWMWSIR